MKLRDWRGRLKILSVHGRALYLKQFVLPKLLFKLSYISIPDEVLVKMQRKLDFFLLEWEALGITRSPERTDDKSEGCSSGARLPGRTALLEPTSTCPNAS